MEKGQSGIGGAFSLIVAFILGGTGLSILYNAGGDTVDIVGGFALVGIAVAIVYRIIDNG